MRHHIAWLALLAVVASGCGMAPSDPARPSAVSQRTVLAATPPRIAVAGDIACSPADPNFNDNAGSDTLCRHRATSDLLVGKGYRKVLTVGDNQYERGALRAFRASYDPTWGRVKGRTRPVPGNHEYKIAGADGYFDYFGSAAGRRSRGYYSFDVGAWHLVALNSNCAEVGGCGIGSRQQQWLAADLQAHPAACTLAYWHHPRFSSGRHGNNRSVAGLVKTLYEHHADVVVAGHDHSYERFANISPRNRHRPKRGIRHFVVGTGGKNHYPFETVRRNSQVRDAETYGVLEITLHPRRYEWRFVAEAGSSFSDSGDTACR